MHDAFMHSFNQSIHSISRDVSWGVMCMRWCITCNFDRFSVQAVEGILWSSQTNDLLFCDNTHNIMGCCLPCCTRWSSRVDVPENTTSVGSDTTGCDGRAAVPLALGDSEKAITSPFLASLRESLRRARSNLGPRGVRVEAPLTYRVPAPKFVVRKAKANSSSTTYGVASIHTCAPTESQWQGLCRDNHSREGSSRSSRNRLAREARLQRIVGRLFQSTPDFTCSLTVQGPDSWTR